MIYFLFLTLVETWEMRNEVKRKAPQVGKVFIFKSHLGNLYMGQTTSR